MARARTLQRSIQMLVWLIFVLAILSASGTEARSRRPSKEIGQLMPRAPKRPLEVNPEDVASCSAPSAGEALIPYEHPKKEDCPYRHEWRGSYCSVRAPQVSPSYYKTCMKDWFETLYGRPRPKPTYPRPDGSNPEGVLAYDKSLEEDRERWDSGFRPKLKNEYEAMQVKGKCCTS